MRQAVKVSEAGNYHEGQRQSIPTFEYYDSPIEIEGKPYMAHIRVRNTLMGDRYYGHTVSEIDGIEIEPSARTSDPVNPAVQPVNAIDSSECKIEQGAEIVNPSGGTGAAPQLNGAEKRGSSPGLSCRTSLNRAVKKAARKSRLKSSRRRLLCCENCGLRVISRASKHGSDVPPAFRRLSSGVRPFRPPFLR